MAPKNRLERQRIGLSDEAFEYRRKRAEESSPVSTVSEVEDTNSEPSQGLVSRKSADDTWSEKAGGGFSSAHVFYDKTQENPTPKLGLIDAVQGSGEPVDRKGLFYTQVVQELKEPNKRDLKIKERVLQRLEEIKEQRRVKDGDTYNGELQHAKGYLTIAERYFTASGDSRKRPYSKEQSVGIVEDQLAALRENKKSKDRENILYVSERINLEGEVSKLREKIPETQRIIAQLTREEKDQTNKGQDTTELSSRIAGLNQFIDRISNDLEYKESLLEMIDTGIDLKEIEAFSDEDINFYIEERRKIKKIESLGNNIDSLHELGFSNEDVIGLSDREIHTILHTHINKKDWISSFDDSEEKEIQFSLNKIPESKDLLALGFSANEILHVVSEEDRKNILDKKMSRDEWIVESRKKYSNENKSSVQSPETFRGGAKDLEDPFKRSTSEHELKNINFLIEAFRKDRRKAEQEKNQDEVRKIDGDIEILMSRASSLKGGEKIHHWPPQDVQLKDGVVRHWPPVTPALSPEVFRGGAKDLVDPFKIDEQSASVEEVKEVLDTTKEGSGSLSLFDLGYSREEILNFSIEERDEIFKKQIRKEGAPTVVAQFPQQDSLKESAPVTSGEGFYTFKEEYAGHDGSYYSSTRKVSKGELIDLLNNKNSADVSRIAEQKTVGGLTPSVIEKVAPANPEEIKKLIEEKRLRRQALDDFEKNKEELERNGWSLETYGNLTETERQFVFWHHVKAGDFKKEGDGNVSTESTTEQASEEETVDEFVDSLVTGDRIKEGKISLTESEMVFYNKYKDQVDAEMSRRDAQRKEQYELSARGVSEGAKVFLKQERGAAEVAREQKSFAEVLEKGYENFDKTKLIEIAKGRGLPSGGDNQTLIERIAKDDAEKNREDFGFASEQVKNKLADYSLSEKQMLKLSPEFFSLSSEKQMYLFSKLEQKIYRDTDFASKDKNEEEMKKMGFWKRLSASFAKGQRQVSLREQMIQKIKSGGILEYGQDISALNTYLLDTPELRYEPNEKGRLVPYFEYVDTASSDKKFETPKTFLNISASRFGEVPFEWSLPSATSRQREMYQQAFSSYTGAKESYVKSILDEAAKKNPNLSSEERTTLEKKARLEMMRTDAKVRFGSFITQNPEMETLSASFVEKVLGAKANDFTRGALFAGAGFATKWLGRSMAVTGVGLGASAAVGGYMAYRKKNLEYTEKELRQRYGKESNDLWLKKPANSSNVYGRLEKLVGQLEKTTDEKSKQKILETIKTRIFVTEELMRDGRINFGNQKEQTANEFKLAEMMSKAAISVEMNGGFTKEKTKEEELLERFKEFVQDSDVQNEKNTVRALALTKGAAVGLLGFEIGYGLRYAQEHGYLGAVWEVISEKGAEGFNKAKELLSSLSSEDAEFGTSKGAILESSNTPSPNQTNVEVEKVMAGARGAIGAIDDLQDKLRDKFGTAVPEQYQEFLSKDPNKLAQEWGFYKPGEAEESAVIKKGEGFSIDQRGVIRFAGLNGAEEVYVPENVKDVTVPGSERKFFDASQMESANVAQKPSVVETEVLSESRTPATSGALDTSNQNSTVRGSIPEERGSIADTRPGQRTVVNPLEATNPSVRGEWKFTTSPEGKITGINTSKTISEDVLRFRRNPRSFMTEDLSSTTLLAKTDSFAVKTLTNNRELIEQLLVQKNILNTPTANLTAEESLFLKQNVLKLNKEIVLKTGGAFNGKYDEVAIAEQLGRKPIHFSTDNPIEPKVNPSITSTIEDSPSTSQKATVPAEESVGRRKPADALERIQKIREEKLAQANTPESPVKSPSESGVSVVSLSANEKTYSFNTENIKGKIRFVFDERGAITDVQDSTFTVIKGLDRPETLLKDDWMTKVKQYSIDEATGIKKIRSDMKALKEHLIILEEGKFTPNSLEYKYLLSQVNAFKAKYVDILK